MLSIIFSCTGCNKWMLRHLRISVLISPRYKTLFCHTKMLVLLKTKDSATLWHQQEIWNLAIWIPPPQPLQHGHLLLIQLWVPLAKVIFGNPGVMHSASLHPALDEDKWNAYQKWNASHLDYQRSAGWRNRRHPGFKLGPDSREKQLLPPVILPRSDSQIGGSYSIKLRHFLSV